MSAIFGLIRHDSAPVPMEMLQLMAEPVLARGPDGVGLHVEGSVGLGVVRLQTCPELEPVDIDGTGSLVVVAAARLDNRDELVSSLDLERQTPDTGIITNAHRKWGRDAVQHLLGDFAFAVWDRAEQKLTLVRDQIGVRPLCLAKTKGFTAFASDPRSLLALSEVSKEIDEVGIFYFFFPEVGDSDKEWTCHAAVKRLPPAHLLELTRDGEVHRQIYWALDPERELRLANDQEYIEAFRDRFTIAVKRRLRSSGEVGSTLSGGLDSSSITCVAAKLLAENQYPRLHTYSAVFPDSPEADESFFSQAVAKHAEVTAHQVRPGEQSPLTGLQQMLEAVTLPIYMPNYFIPSGVCRAAQADGLRIMLDGTDGDSTVGHGLDLLREISAQHDWARFSRETVAVTKRFDCQIYATQEGIVYSHALPELQRLAQQGKWLSLLRGVNVLGKALGLSRKKVLSLALAGRKKRRPGIPDYSYLDPDFVARVQGVELLEEFSRSFFSLPSGRRPIHWQSLTSGAAPHSLEALDRIGAMHCVEYRYPFCDRELIEFCMAMPSDMQLRNGWSRWILRKAMESYLPDQVCWRGGKADLASIFDRGLRVFEGAGLERLAQMPPQKVLHFIRRDSLKEAHEKYFSKRNVSARRLLWKASVLATWHNDFNDYP